MTDRFDTYKEALEAASADESLMAVDRGTSVYPRYAVIRKPQVGDDVSYAFNGDYYPDGQIASISKSMKVITTTNGHKFYRRKESGSWVMNGTWTLVNGHIDRRNPSF
jgi:hypothetical protein